VQVPAANSPELGKNGIATNGNQYNTLSVNPILLTDQKNRPVNTGGRGSTPMMENVKFEPPKKVSDTGKPTLKKNGMFNIKKKVKEDQPQGKNEEPYDADMNINWKYLESKRKRKPCKKLIKKINKNLS